ncbi:hypothetical protein Tco_1262228 [Tanacetum coccineum]
MFVPSDSTVPKLQTAEDLQGDALLHYDAEMELMNLILLSIPNEIYNSVDACTTAKEMWKRVEREALVSVYNRFAQLMNDLEQNKMIFPIVTVNTKFLNSLQPEWLKYVTQVRLAKRLTVDSFDDLFDYLQQFEKLVNASRAKKLEKSHDPFSFSNRVHLPEIQLLLCLHILRGAVVDYDGCLPARMINQAIIQGDRVNIQSRNSGNTGRDTRRAYVQEEVAEGSNAQNETENVQRTLRTSSSGNTSTVQCYNCSGKGHYARNLLLTDEQNDFLFADASRMEETEELSANICLIARIQPSNNTSDDGPSYDSAFISENCWTIDYQQINALYKDFVPQKELSAEQKYFPSSFIPSDKTSNATSSIPASMPNQVKPIVNELQFYFEFFRKLFQRDIKEMKDVFESTESELCEIKKQNDVLKDQLLEASLKHEVEISVLLNHECEDNSLHAELEQVKKNSIEIQEGLQAKIKILEKDVS